MLKNFAKLLAGKNVMNDYKFFKDKMDVQSQEKSIERT